MDIVATIPALAAASGEAVQVQCIIHPDWGTPYWRVYVGLCCLATRSPLPEALEEAGKAVALRQYAKGA